MKRRVLVTGASRGIGRAIAVALAADGFELALGYRSGEEAARAVQAEIRDAGGEGTLLAFDVADRAAAAEALEGDIRERGAYWGAVLNAGVTADAPLAMLSGEDWDRVLRTNLDGFYNVIKPVLMPMVRLRNGGRVVTLSSVSGLTGNRGQANYAASKGGLVAATRSLAQEVAKRGITVNSVAPGYIETDMIAGLELDEVVAGIPLRRLGRPEEVAGAVSYLFSERAAYVTGQVLSVNGGLV